MYRPGENADLIRNRLEEIPGGVDLEDTRWGEDTVERIVSLAKRGKMVRGSLLIDSVEAMDGSREEAVKYAVAVELIHTGLLIHDDIIDGDPKRRGSDALHIQYSEKFEGISEGAAEDLAVCAGDICFFLAMEVASSSDSDIRVINLFSEIFSRVGSGQIRDIESSERGTPMNVEEVLDFYRNKTACYTFSLPLRTASLVARDQDSELLDEIGTELGVLYQVKDDELDFRPEEQSGKTSLSDLREGKNTIFTAKLLEKEADGGEVKDLIQTGATLEKAEEMRERMKDEGIDEEVEKMMDERSEEIKQKASDIFENSELQELLVKVTDLVVERKR